jgi:antitoxin component of RelBE/YafQ-DinJ toxin-antitoxin module
MLRQNKPKDFTRVTVDFPYKDHRRLKAVTALMGISMQDYILDCVEEKLYSTNIPNVRTRKAIEDVEKGKGVKVAKDIEELKKQLGL